MNDDDLAIALGDLGAHLDVGTEDLAGSVLARLEARGTGDPPLRDRRRWPVLAAAAAVVVVILVVGLLAVTPTREAIADWLGIGGVRVARARSLGRALPPPPPFRLVRIFSLDAARRMVPFPLRTVDPALGGRPVAVSVDDRLASGLVEIRYRDFLLVQLGSQPGTPPVLEKVVDAGTTITRVSVDGHPGFWLSGDPHEIGIIGPDGQLEVDAVRLAGDVLVWEEDGVTYRVEGLTTLDDALEVARRLQ